MPCCNLQNPSLQEELIILDDDLLGQNDGDSVWRKGLLLLRLLGRFQDPAKVEELGLRSVRQGLCFDSPSASGFNKGMGNFRVWVLGFAVEFCRLLQLVA